MCDASVQPLTSVLLYIAYLVGGLALLFLGAEWLVRGSAALALRAGVGTLVVGLTVVAFGTSAPELVVSVQAALEDAGGVAIGNVVGSNIANVALILGVASLIHPIKVEMRLLRLELPLLVAVSGLLAWFLIDRELSRGEGAVLLVGFVSYIAFTLWHARRDHAAPSPDALPSAEGSTLRNVTLILLGLGALILGANGLVRGAVAIADAVGVPPAIVGLTLVAVGTSLPELATSVLAARRGSSDLAIGNVVGSNLFNALGVLGLAAVVHPLTAPGLRTADLGVLVAMSLLLLPLARTGFVLSRLEGAVLLALYAAYTVWLLA